MEQTVDVLVPQDMKGIEYVAPAPAVARRRRTAKRVAPAPAAAYAVPARVIEYVAPSPAGTCAATSSSDRVCVIFTCRCLCSAYSSESTRGAHTCRLDAADLSRMNKEQLTVAAAAAAASVTAALAEAEAAQRELLEAKTTLADLAAEALLLEEEQETQQAAKKKAKHKHMKR